LMFAAITLGGLGSAYGALVGGIIVGVLVELATLVVPTELKNTPALAILIIVLLVRPQGILGRSERVG
jgi:branched-subunit amino acid ABC-type transport system permease component